MIIVFFRCLAFGTPLEDCLIRRHHIFRRRGWCNRFRVWLTSERFWVEYDCFVRTFDE